MVKDGPFEVFRRLLVGTQGAWEAVLVEKNALLEVFQGLEALGGPRGSFVMKTGLLGAWQTVIVVKNCLLDVFQGL